MFAVSVEKNHFRDKSGVQSCFQFVAGHGDSSAILFPHQIHQVQIRVGLNCVKDVHSSAHSNWLNCIFITLQLNWLHYLNVSMRNELSEILGCCDKVALDCKYTWVWPICCHHLRHSHLFSPTRSLQFKPNFFYILITLKNSFRLKQQKTKVTYYDLMYRCIFTTKVII